MYSPRRPNRILFRIILPFTLLFAVITLLTWASSVLLTGHFFDKGLRMQLLRVANGISHSGFLLNPHVLRQVKEMVDADIVLFTPSGQVMSSTIDQQWLHEGPILSLMRNGQGTVRLPGKEVTINGEVFRVVFQEVRLEDRGRAYLSLWQSSAVADSFKNSILATTGAIALLGLVSLVVAGYMVARSISIPVVQLASITERVANGDFSSRVEARGGNEIAMLGHSFNTMIDRLLASERKLVETEKLAAVGQLAAGVAHEIKNPLTSIKMFVQVLQGRMAADPKNRETLDVVLSEINRLDRIVEQIVQRARPDEGIYLEMCQPVPLLQEVLTLCMDSLGAARVEVETGFSPDIPLLALDRARIKQVFWNIILNARDAMPNGGKLVVTVRRAAFGDMVELIFADTGTGLADLDSETCFRSFFTTKPEGLGLGLSMSRKIVEKHRGGLHLRSRPGGGAMAVLTLPCV